MITGEIKSQVDRVWDAFWSGGISNPLEVIEQITYLLFLRRLDDLHTLEENKSARLKKPMERRIFPEGNDAKGRPYEDLRWSRFKHQAPAEMYTIVGEHEADIKRGRIAVTAPVARAIIGRHAGDLVQVRAPKGSKEYEVVEVRFEPLDDD